MSYLVFERLDVVTEKCEHFQRTRGGGLARLLLTIESSASPRVTTYECRSRQVVEEEEGVFMPRAAKSQPTALPGPRLVAKSARVPQQQPVSTEQIAMRAYELYLRDGAVHGRDVEHWLRAEEELRAPAEPAPVSKVAGARKPKQS